MSVTLYTSDTHFGHELVARDRGFNSVSEHDEELARRWNEAVRPEDTVWVLGDVALGKRVETLAIFERLNGTKHLVWGNHDNCGTQQNHSWTYHALYLQYFKTIQPFAVHRIAGQKVMLSHYPYTSDRPDLEARNMQYRLRDEGRFLLHGHLHSPVQRTSAREIHVGLDAWDLVPVTQHVIAQLITQQLSKEGAGNATPQETPV